MKRSWIGFVLLLVLLAGGIAATWGMAKCHEPIARDLENAAKTAKKAYKENISLKEACVALGFLTEEKFDEVFHPENMV